MRIGYRSLQLPLALVLVATRGWAQQSEGEGAAPRSGPGAVVREQPAPEGEKPKAPVVVPPSLVHFEDAPYPPDAQKQGLQADVILKLTIDREGNVTQAVSTQPVGNGFDQAAEQAALKFKFQPATRNGQPIPSQILYKYSFTLKEAAPPADAPPAPPPNTGELSGALRLADGDAALAGAEVEIVLPDGSQRRVTTDADGRFAIKPAPAGHYRLHVVAEGFRELRQEEDVVAGEVTEVIYRAAPLPTGIEILVEGERPAREVTRRTIERREIERIPGTGGDALRSLQALPGVARTPGLLGLLIIRGSAPQDTNAFIDGSLTPLVYHFGGLSSVVPTEMLDRIDFYPGNFSARFGRVQGGIIDVGLRSPNTRCTGDYGKRSDALGCYHGLLQLDAIDARLMVQGPVGKSKDWSFAIAGRRSWLDTWLKPVLKSSGVGVSTAPVYYDYQAILERRHDKARTSLRFYGSDDRLDILINDPAAQDPAFGGNLTFGTGFYRLQALHQDQLNKVVTTDSMLSFGRNTLDFSIGTFLFKLKSTPFYGRQEFGFRLANGVKFNAGLDFLVVPYEVQVRFPQPPRPGEPDPGPFAAQPPRESRQQGTVFRPGWYGEFELQPSARLRVIPGLRFDYARDSGHADMSPRINARFDVIPAASAEEQAAGSQRRRTTVKGGVGLFHQPPQFQETDVVFGTPNLKSNRAVHYSLGVEQELTRQVDLNVEGFYKDLTRQVAPAPLTSGNQYSNLGLGSVIGLEVLLKYKPDKNFFGWVAYTLSRSVRKNTPDEPERLFQFDQTHNLTVLGSYRLGRGWEFGARFRVVSGALVTPVVSQPSLPSLYAADAGSYAPLQGPQFSQRLPLFHQLDMRVDKRWQFQRWSFSAYLDVQNVYSNRAAEDLTYNYNYSQQQYQLGIPIIPSLGLRGEF
ncbi:MAG: TonB-dependent receptor domain-containing protein [Myxococcota bacterium]